MHVPWRQLRQAVRVGDILVHEETAPATLDGIEIRPVIRDAWADNAHVASALISQRLAGTVWNAVFFLQHDFLLEQKILQLGIGREFKTQRRDDLLEEILQRFFS